jgi:phage regulator Rha-like protein
MQAEKYASVKTAFRALISSLSRVGTFSPTVTSRDVASLFGIPHDHLLRDIRRERANTTRRKTSTWFRESADGQGFDLELSGLVAVVWSMPPSNETAVAFIETYRDVYEEMRAALIARGGAAAAEQRQRDTELREAEAAAIELHAARLWTRPSETKH